MEPYKYMTNHSTAESPAHEIMRRHGIERLQKRAASEVVQRGGVCFDETAVHFESLGQKISVAFPHCRVVFAETGEEPHWLWSVIMLHYLDAADGTPLSHEVITFSQLSGGITRGHAFDKESAQTIAEKIGNLSPGRIISACKALGADLVKSNADICAVFYFAPRFPITIKIWFADDELPTSGKMLLNKEAPHYLSTEDIVMAGSLLLEFLIAQCRL